MWTSEQSFWAAHMADIAFVLWLGISANSWVWELNSVRPLPLFIRLRPQWPYDLVPSCPLCDLALTALWHTPRCDSPKSHCSVIRSVCLCRCVCVCACGWICWFVHFVIVLLDWSACGPADVVVSVWFHTPLIKKTLCVNLTAPPVKVNLTPPNSSAPLQSTLCDWK